jgi:hypothetical protein
MSWDGESWRKAAREYAAGRAASRTVLEVEIEPDRLRSLRWLLEDTVSLDRAWHETKFPTALKGRAAFSTLEALMFSLRERGTKALEEVDTRRRLSELSDDQLAEVGTRLQRLKPHIAPAWSDDDVKILVQTRKGLPT